MTLLGLLVRDIKRCAADSGYILPLRRQNLVKYPQDQMRTYMLIAIKTYGKIYTKTNKYGSQLKNIRLYKSDYYGSDVSTRLPKTCL